MVDLALCTAGYVHIHPAGGCRHRHALNEGLAVGAVGEMACITLFV